MDDAPNPNFMSMPGSCPGSYPGSYPNSSSSSYPNSIPGEISKPNYSNTSGETKDKTLKEIKQFETELNNKKYTLELARSENDKNLVIKLYEKKKYILSSYIAYINFEQFKNINSIFSFYSNIREIYNLLLTHLEGKKFFLTLKNSNDLIITFNFVMPGEKKINVEFYLKEEKVNNNNNLMSDIYEMVEKIEKENDKFKEEINLLKNNEKKMKDELNKKNDEMINMKNDLNEIKNDNFILKQKIKNLEDKLNNLNSINNNIKNNTDKNEVIKEEKKPIAQPTIIHRRPNYEYLSVPNCDNNNVNNINQNKNKKPKNEIIDEDDDDNKIIEEIKKEQKEEHNKIREEIKNIDLPLTKTKSTPSKINLENIDIDSFFTSSKIVTSKKEKTNLYTWISSKSGHILEIKLLFQSSINGDSYDTFIEKCGNKGPTLSLIKSKKKKKFGGFCKVQLPNKKESFQLKDESAFVFSLNKGEKYDVLQPDIAVSSIPDNFIIMYGNRNDRYGLRVKHEFLDEEKKNYENFGKKTYNVPENFSLSGENVFYIDEFEVFQIIFA